MDRADPKGGWPDREAIGRELERLHRESFGWALACCGRKPAEAEDVLQTVYLKILEGRARYGGQASFKTWLFAVIRRTAQDKARRATVRQLLQGRYAGSLERAGSAEVDEGIVREADRGVLRQALATLSHSLFSWLWHSASA